ncbi:hypothetical protein LJR290_007845 [Variovorax sp. LjRoot290]
MNDSKNGMAMKIVVNVLAVIGGIAVLSVIGMALMHTGMMGGLVC